MSTSSSVSAPSSTPLSLTTRWANAFLGHHPAQRAAIRRLAYIWFTYAVVDVALITASSLGLTPLWTSIPQAIYHWLGLTGFYIALRSGRTLKRREPSLAFEQLLFGVSAIVLSYAVSPITRGAALQLLCLALVFDMKRLSSRQLTFAAWGAVALMLVALSLSWMLRPEGFNVRREALNLMMAGFQLPALSMIARDVRAMRQKQLKQRVDLQSTLARLEHLSQRDSLTSLFNRHHMGLLIDQELKRMSRKGRPFSVALIDIDHFKNINDQYGHAVGDVVLQTFARLAQKHLPLADSIARWGGEEFLVLIPERPVIEAVAIIETFRQKVQAHDWEKVSPGLAVRFSAGVTEHLRPTDLIHHTLERADMALYRAKAHGRNQVRFEKAHHQKAQGEKAQGAS